MAHEGLWEQLEKLDPEQTAERADCRYIRNPSRHVVTMLNTQYTVDLTERKIAVFAGDSRTRKAAFLERLCILAYLINAKDVPLAEKLVKAESLPGGQFFFRGLHALPTGKMEKAFGDNPDDLLEASERFGAIRRDFGDASIELLALPRIPITVVIWAGDDEFPARASMLFDKTAAEHLPLDALWTLANLSAKALIDSNQTP